MFAANTLVELTPEARKQYSHRPDAEKAQWHPTFKKMVEDGVASTVSYNVHGSIYFVDGGFWIPYENLRLSIKDPLLEKQVSAFSLLERAAGHLKDRAVTYDKPEGERSIGATVEAFKAITGVELTEEQGWMFLLLLKIVRSQQGAFKLDNYEDGSAYFALMGEAAATERLGG